MGMRGGVTIGDYGFRLGMRGHDPDFVHAWTRIRVGLVWGLCRGYDPDVVFGSTRVCLGFVWDLCRVQLVYFGGSCDFSHALSSCNFSHALSTSANYLDCLADWLPH